MVASAAGLETMGPAAALASTAGGSAANCSCGLGRGAAVSLFDGGVIGDGAAFGAAGISAAATCGTPGEPRADSSQMDRKAAKLIARTPGTRPSRPLPSA